MIQTLGLYNIFYIPTDTSWKSNVFYLYGTSSLHINNISQDKIKPIQEKISLLEEIVKVVDGNKIHTQYSAYGFLQSIKQQCNNRLSLSEKQMGALNKVYKKYKPKFDEKFDK